MKKDEDGNPLTKNFGEREIHCDSFLRRWGPWWRRDTDWRINFSKIRPYGWPLASILPEGRDGADVLLDWAIAARNSTSRAGKPIKIQGSDRVFVDGDGRRKPRKLEVRSMKIRDLEIERLEMRDWRWEIVRIGSFTLLILFVFPHKCRSRQNEILDFENWIEFPLSQRGRGDFGNAKSVLRFGLRA